MTKSRWVALLVALAVAAGLLYERFGTITLSVTSSTEGAVVWLDGQRLGVTPLKDADIPGGRHLLRLEHPHFAPYETQLDTTLGARIQHHAELLVGEGSLKLLSNPKGAWVSIGGERVDGETPLIVTLPSGVHEIAMGLEERRTVKQEVLVKHAEEGELRLELNIDPHGSVAISTSPAGASVVFPDLDLRYTSGLRVPIGEHVIRASRKGYRTATVRKMVQYGDNRFHIELERAFGTLRVTTTPADAEVSVTSASSGSLRYTPGMRLPAGDVEVRVRALGYRSAFRRLTITESAAETHFDLQRMRVEVGAEIRDALKAGGKAPAMVVLAAGSFQMGDAQGGPSERPQHRVTLTQPFALSRYEVTVGEYLLFAEATGTRVSEKLDRGRTDHPMAFVSHEDARAYARWLSDQTGALYRLPTESEWEYAARAGASSRYPFGDEVSDICAHGNVSDQATKKRYRDWLVVACDDGQVRPGPVGRYQANAFGLHDMLGNVAEWVLECGTPSYDRAPGDGRMRSSLGGCSAYGFRGGSWDSGPDEVTPAYRNATSRVSDDRGIRLLREL